MHSPGVLIIDSFHTSLPFVFFRGGVRILSRKTFLVVFMPEFALVGIDGTSFG